MDSSFEDFAAKIMPSESEEDNEDESDESIESTGMIHFISFR